MQTKRFTRERLGTRILVNAVAAAFLAGVAVSGNAQGAGSGTPAGDPGRPMADNPGGSGAGGVRPETQGRAPARTTLFGADGTSGSGTASGEEKALGSPGGNSMSSPGPGRGSSIGTGGSGAGSGGGGGGAMSNPGMGGGSLGLSGSSGATPPAGRN